MRRGTEAQWTQGSWSPMPGGHLYKENQAIKKKKRKGGEQAEQRAFSGQ